MYLDNNKVNNKQILKKIGYIQIIGRMYGYNEVSKKLMYQIEIRGAYSSRKDLQKAKNFIFEAAKIAYGNIHYISDIELQLEFPMYFKHDRKEKRMALEQIQDLARNYQ